MSREELKTQLTSVMGELNAKIAVLQQNKSEMEVVLQNVQNSQAPVEEKQWAAEQYDRASKANQRQLDRYTQAVQRIQDQLDRFDDEAVQVRVAAVLEWFNENAADLVSGGGGTSEGGSALRAVQGAFGEAHLFQCQDEELTRIEKLQVNPFLTLEQKLKMITGDPLLR